MSVLITAEVWQYAPVSAGNLIVLLRMADSAGDEHRMMWESVATLAKRSRMSERNVYHCLKDLEAKRIVAVVPKEEAPPEASHYKSVVRRILPVDQWLTEPPKGENTAPEKFAGVGESSCDVSTPGTPENSSPCNGLHPTHISITSSREIEETTSLLGAHRAREEAHSRPGSKGWAAVRPLRGPGGRRKSRKQVAEEAAAAEKELDPAYVVAQVLGSDAPGDVQSAALAALDDDLAPPVRQGRKTRSKRPCERLAEYFEREAQRVGSEVPGTTNKAALARNLQRWMDEGAEYNTISKMIAEYWSESWQRSSTDPAWKDFQNQRGLLTQRLGKAADVERTEANRYDESAW